MHKKGASSLEFILAFVLFASFTVAVLYFFNPVKTLKNMDYSRDYTLNKIIENTSVDLDSYSIIIDQSALSPIIIEIPGMGNEKHVGAVNYGGVMVDAKRKSIDEFCVDISNIDIINNKKFATLYFSEDIAESTGLSCIQDLDKSKYNIASSLTDKVISESRFLLLNNSYPDYSALKTQLGIPADVDFSFSLILGEIKIVAGGPPEEITREIFSETVRKEVLGTDGIPQFGELTVSVW